MNRDIITKAKPILFCLAIFVFAIAHTLFMRFKLPAYGPRIGTYLDDISYAMWIAVFLYLIFSMPVIIRAIVLFIFIFLIQFLVFGEWWNFEFYRDYIRFASLGHAGDWQEVARGFSGFQSRYLAIVGSIGFIIAAYLLLKYSKSLATSVGNRLFLFSGFMLMALIPTSLFTKYYVDTQVENWHKSTVIPLNYKNPIMQLFRERFIDNAQIATITPQHIDAVNNLYKNASSVYPFYKNGNNNTAFEAKNIIFIILESIRQTETIPKNGIDLTPNLNSISSRNFTPKYYYANSNQTIKAEIALLCGVHDFLIGTSISAPNHQQVKTNCLPNILKKYDYRNYWFHGAKSDFFNRSEFLPKIGFDELHDQLSIETEYQERGEPYLLRHWGVEDPYTFDYALTYLKQQSQPFLAEILTVSNHHPFVDIETEFDEEDFHPDLPRNLEDTYNRYQHLVHYTDKALGKFWKEFEQSDLYENTIVVISGDHGIWLFSDELENSSVDKATFQYESYLRLPLTIYFPGLEFTERVNVAMSQVDVPELITNYLGIGDSRAFQSKLDSEKIQQLLTPEKANQKTVNPIFSSIGDNFYYRNDSVICYPPLLTRENCEDYLFRCVEEHNQLNTDKHCVSIDGDALSDVTTTASTEHELSSVNTVVDYFRKSIFFGSLPDKEIISPQIELN